MSTPFASFDHQLFIQKFFLKKQIQLARKKIKRDLDKILFMPTGHHHHPEYVSRLQQQHKNIRHTGNITSVNVILNTTRENLYIFAKIYKKNKTKQMHS